MKLAMPIWIYAPVSGGDTQEEVLVLANQPGRYDTATMILKVHSDTEPAGPGIGIGGEYTVRRTKNPRDTGFPSECTDITGEIADSTFVFKLRVPLAPHPPPLDERPKPPEQPKEVKFTSMEENDPFVKKVRAEIELAAKQLTQEEIATLIQQMLREARELDLKQDEIEDFFKQKIKEEAKQGEQEEPEPDPGEVPDREEPDPEEPDPPPDEVPDPDEPPPPPDEVPEPDEPPPPDEEPDLVPEEVPVPEEEGPEPAPDPEPGKFGEGGEEPDLSEPIPRVLDPSGERQEEERDEQADI